MVTNLRLLRVKTGKTLRETARELGIPESTLCRIERAQLYVSPKLRERLAKFYGVDVEEICDENGWPRLVEK